MTVKKLSVRARRATTPAKKIVKKKTYQSRAAIEAQRTINKIDRAAVKIITMVVKKAQRNGVLTAYDGVETAREARAIIIKIFAEFSRSAEFRRMSADYM